MRRHLPPFPAVRAFEAAARHLNFKKAADELCITQSAVSHQVRALENYLGVKLFHRETRGVLLTAEGAGYLAGISDILDRMAAETARVRRREFGGRLSVRAAPGFVRWLVPRLASFHEAYPDIELSLSGSLIKADFASEEVDVNIRWGYEPQAGLFVTPLAASSRFPVISPDLLRKGPAVERPRDLRRFTLLHEAGCPGFENWFAFAGETAETSRRGLNFASYDHLLQAAIDGQGVGLGYGFVVEKDLESRALVRLFDLQFPARVLYSLVTPNSWLERPRIAAFRAWLIREVGTLSAANGLPALVASGEIAVHARP